MIETTHPLLTEWLQLTETLHTHIQNKLKKPDTLECIYISRFHFMISKQMDNPITETEFPKLFSLMIIIIYIQTAYLNKKKKTDFGDDWFSDWYILHFFLTGSLNSNYASMIRSKEKIPTLLVSFYEALDMIIIPSELKILIMTISKWFDSQQDILPLIENYITHIYPTLKGTPWPMLSHQTSSDFLIQAFNTLSSKQINKTQYLQYRSLAKNTLKQQSPQPRLG